MAGLGISMGGLHSPHVTHLIACGSCEHTRHNSPHDFFQTHLKNLPECKVLSFLQQHHAMCYCFSSVNLHYAFLWAYSTCFRSFLEVINRSHFKTEHGRVFLNIFLPLTFCTTDEAINDLAYFHCLTD